MTVQEVGLFQFILDKLWLKSIAGALELLQLSQKHKVHHLTLKCEEFLQTEIPILDSVKVFEAAFRYGRGELMDRVGPIMVKSFLELARTDAILNAEEDTLAYLLECDDLAVPEVGLFQFILDWGRNLIGTSVDEQILRNKLKSLTAKIRYTNMAPEEFTKVVLPTGLLSPEDSLWVYSYFCGDGDKRRGLKTKFNTTLRKVESTGTVTEFVDFYADHEDSLTAFSKHSISFQAERMQVDGQVLPDYLLKKTVISAIHLWCPVGSSKSSEDQTVSLNLNVSLMEYAGPVPEEKFTLKFQTKIFIRKQKIGSEVVPVEPAVDLVSGRTYSIIDYSNTDLTGSIRKDPRAYWGISIPNMNQEANINLENVCLTLKGIQRKTDHFAQQFSSRCEELAVIDGVQIGLV